MTISSRRVGSAILALAMIFTCSGARATSLAECLESIPQDAFIGSEKIKIIVTGFGYPDSRADLFGLRYASILQSLASTAGGRGDDAEATANIPGWYNQIVQYVPCEVNSHAVARQLGQQAGVDLVIWGNVSWRDWQSSRRLANAPSRARSASPERDSTPEIAASRDQSQQTDKPSAPAAQKQIVNEISGPVGEITQNLTVLGAPSTAIVKPNMVMVRWPGLDVDVEHWIQISDHKDLKGESDQILFSNQQRAILRLALADREIDQKNFRNANYHIKQMTALLAGQYIQIVRRARESVNLLIKLSKSIANEENYDGALTMLARALELCSTSDIHCQAEARDALGTVHQQKGALADAQREYTEALGLWLQTQKPDKAAATHLALAQVFREKSEFVDAIYHVTKQISIDETVQDKNRVRLGTGLLLLGESYNLSGECAKAIDPLKRALGIFDSMDSENDAELLKTYAGLAMALAQTGLHSKAIDYYKDEIKIHQKLGHKRDIADRYDDIATLYARMGNSAAAIEHYEEAATLFAEAKDPDLEAAFGSLRRALPFCGEKTKQARLCAERINSKLQVLKDRMNKGIRVLVD